MMKKILLSLILILPTLYAKETCYSVQLLSKRGQKPKDFSLEQFPQECKDMFIGNTFTVRCGCFEQKQDAKSELKTLQKEFPQAIIASTYKYRFSKTTPKAQQTQRTTSNITSVLQIPKTTKTTPKDTSSCYSVEIIHKSKTKHNLDTLLNNTYPQGCKVMVFNYSVGVRCGCKEDKKDLKDLLASLKQDYKASKIVSTYKYRFSDTYTPRIDQNTQTSSQNTTLQNIPPAIDNEEENLRLLLQVFLFKGDIKNGYKVAIFGAKKYPNSIYWNKQAAQLCQWNSKVDESIYYFKQLYQLTHDEALEKDILDYGIGNYEYELIEPIALDKLHKNFTRKNFDLVIFVYKKLGEPEKIISLALKEYKKDPSKRFLLALALRTSLEIGDMQTADTLVKQIQTLIPYTKEEASLLARYYYIQRKFPQSFAALEKADVAKKEDPKVTTKYHMLVSDLGWLLQKKQPAAKSALYLIQHNQARVEDYERVFGTYLESNPSLALNAMQEAYKKFHLSYLFYNYANEAINLERYDGLISFVNYIDKNEPQFQKDPFYWIIKAKIYAHLNQPEEEIKALRKALALNPNSINIKISLLWTFINSNNVHQLKLILADIEESSAQVSSDLYFPLASAYFYLHDINRASYYLDKIEQEHIETNKIEFLFLQGYVYQIQNRPGAFLSNMLKIESLLLDEAKKDPSLWKDSTFLSNYLRSIIHTKQNDFFYKKLQEFKPYLLPKDYEEISYSYANKIDAKELAHQIYLNAVYKPLWMRFTNAIATANHSEIEDYLFMYLESLSAGEAIKAAENDGQIALAQSHNFQGLDYNEFNQNMYIQQRDLSMHRSDILSIKPSYYSRDPLLQKYIDVKNRTYLRDSYYLHYGIRHNINSSIDDTILRNLQDTTSIFVELEKRFAKGTLKALVGYNDKFATYYNYRLYGDYKITDAFTTKLKLSKGENTEESTQLYLAGKKDSIKPAISYNIVPSIYIDLSYEINKYYSNDDVYLGDGTAGRIAVSKVIRSGYPDLLVGTFFDFGNYNEDKIQPNGVIDTIQTQDFYTLPNNFYNIGATFAYGMANSDLYTRVWRPFFSTAAYYNSDLDDFSYSFLCGYGGKIFHQDHLVFGANYIDSVNGIGGTIFELYINYKFLYHLPR